MFEFLLPTALNVLQSDSNRRAQIEQDYINRQYSPWLGNNPAGQFNSQTNAGNAISQGFGAYNAAQDEKARRNEWNDLLSSLTTNQSVANMEDAFKNKNFDTMNNGMVNLSRDPNLASQFTFLA